MVIKIKPLFSDAKIKKFIDEKVYRINFAIVSRMQRVGETFINNARSTYTYHDVTGNLRSSIGYIILKDGVQVSENFEVASRGKYGGLKKVQKKKYGDLKGSEGVAAGKEVADKLAADHPRGFVLIGVAGMNYAAAVESLGYDVITGSSKLAEDQLRTAIRNLQSKL